MGEHNDGGAAFPTIVNPPEIPAKFLTYEGMTLRDWFAGNAINGLIAVSPEEPFLLLAQRAYQMADAMIVARKS